MEKEQNSKTEEKINNKTEVSESSKNDPKEKEIEIEVGTGDRDRGRYRGRDVKSCDASNQKWRVCDSVGYIDISGPFAVFGF